MSYSRLCYGSGIMILTAQLSPIIVPIDGVLWEVIQCTVCCMWGMNYYAVFV